MPSIKCTKPSLRNCYNRLPSSVRDFFGQLDELLRKDISPEVQLAYVFSKWENAQHWILLLGLLKNYNTSRFVTAGVVNSQIYEDGDFEKFYGEIYSQKMLENLLLLQSKLEFRAAKRIRNNVMHGRTALQTEMWAAIKIVLQYADEVNNGINSDYNFEPIRKSYRGVTSSKSPYVLDKIPTVFMLRGMGFRVSKKS